MYYYYLEMIIQRLSNRRHHLWAINRYTTNEITYIEDLYFQLAKMLEQTQAYNALGY